MNLDQEGYIPAALPGSPVMNLEKFNGKRVAWWNDKSYFRYPKILVSAFYGRKYPNIRKEFEIDDDTFLLGDSGGFQNSTMGDLNLSPTEVLYWQQNNCQLGFTLDVPPYNLLDEDKDFSLTDKEFNSKMDKSYENAKVMIDARSKFKEQGFKFYLCIHGDNIERLNRWWSRHDDIRSKFDGYALAPKNKSDPLILAQTLMWLYEKDVKENIHFLAFSGANTIPILIFFMHYIKNITYDSSSYAGGAMRREYFLPMMQDRYIVGDSHFPTWKFLPCSCVVCENLTTEDFRSNSKFGGALMSLHNLKVMIEYDHMLRGLKDDPELYKDYIRKNCSSKTLIGIEYLEYAMKNGRELADEKFNIKATVNTGAKQRNLFGF